ncbi:MAG: DNA polymerase III subunit delta [Methylobacter tundripaludum]|jgi:DNA polymerase-3 subunit delta|uniref:DNA polymerase III subunit delta n=1 Tax=Methylobacter tundripaludum TaxID=173365 RepID=A0A2S6HED3_9GAMM|nr:DNA polymerase III subunit delta [Methylobacter tundripaludum]MDD4905156.1 DNA polymerase III subunit delta [Methylobacter tundripaludum]PPK75837.1 DNA polymerase III delta subunit [Methylobacter tundripaludum]
MRLKPEQIAAALQKGLAPVYFISGDEPLQLGEMADAVRAAARKEGYDSREVLVADSSFSWNELTESAGSLSIFADKKIIDLRLPSGTPGADGSKALIAYCERLPEDTLLLITAAKMAGASLKARWFQALDKVGCVVQVWPLEGQDLIRWLQQRMQRRGLQAETEGIKILASRIEGNLLAAAQEIEKLYVLYGEGRLSNQQISDAVADSSRFDVFKLMDSVLAARVGRIFKILSGLQAEGVAAPVVLWALTREARVLIKIKQALAQGQNRAVVFKNNQIWDKRQQLVSDALNRLGDSDLNSILTLSAKADRQIKGQQQGEPWETLLAVCLMFAVKAKG